MKKKFFLYSLIFASFFIGTSYGQKVKIVDSSSKNKPDWAGAVVKEYIITVGSATTLDGAQQEALNKIKEQIVSSVAENIQTASEYYMNETTHNNSSDFTESYSRATKTKAADMPYMKGISLTNVDEFYWEQLKKDDEITFNYYLKYPFSQIQLKKLVLEFEQKEKELTDQLMALLNKIDGIESTEDMSQTIKELEVLSNSFIEVDPRKDQAAVGIAKLKEMLKNINIETISNSLGNLTLMLKLGEKTIVTTHKPTVKSNCAKITDVKQLNKNWIISYNYDECYDDPDNKISVTFRNGYGTASNEYYFNINADKIDIYVNNDINLTGSPNTTTCTMSVTSKYDSEFIIDKVILNFGDEAPIIIDQLNQSFQGKGNHDLIISVPIELNPEIYTSKKYPMIKGSIFYHSAKSGEKSIYKMFNQSITTSW